jgi:hypothetical protein
MNLPSDVARCNGQQEPICDDCQRRTQIALDALAIIHTSRPSHVGTTASNTFRTGLAYKVPQKVPMRGKLKLNSRAHDALHGFGQSHVGHQRRLAISPILCEICDCTHGVAPCVGWPGFRQTAQSNR